MIQSPHVCSNPEELGAVALALLKAFPADRIFALSGKMGAGKTTFIKAFCRQLGVTDMVTSPTFALVNEYRGSEDKSIYHFDFYRIKSLREVMDLGYEEYFFSGSYCFLEWPELIAELLSPPCVYISLQEMDQGRREISWRRLDDVD